MRSINALAWDQVDAIVKRFEQLNPYDRELVPGSILKIEEQNFAGELRVQLYAFAISAKRYATFHLTGDELRLRKASEHGLGHLMPPLSGDEQFAAESSSAPEWIKTFWRILICEYLGRPATPPTWLQRPAISRISITSADLLERFGGLRRDVWYRNRIKPFNFLLSAHIAAMGHSSAVDPARCHLFAPYEQDPAKWLEIEWTDRSTGKTHGIRASGSRADDSLRVKSYADVLQEHLVHTEPKSASQDGSPCKRNTTGLLTRRFIRAAAVTYISKEARRIDEVIAGLLHDVREVLDEYVDPAHTPLDEHWRAKLKDIPSAQLAAKAGISRRSVRNIRNGHKRPGQETERRLRDAVTKYKGVYVPPTDKPEAGGSNSSDSRE